MTTLNVNIGSANYRIIMIRGSVECQQLAALTGVPLPLCNELFGGLAPMVKGTCFYRRHIIVLTWTGSKNSILECFRHEVAHAIAFELGLDPKSEEFADKIAGIFVSTGRVLKSLRTVLDNAADYPENGALGAGSTISGGDVTLKREEALVRLNEINATVESASSSGRLENCTVQESREEDFALSLMGINGDVVDTLKSASKIEVVFPKRMPYYPCAVEIRVHTPKQRVDMNTSVTDMKQWHRLRDSLRAVAESKRIQFVVTFI